MWEEGKALPPCGPGWPRRGSCGRAAPRRRTGRTAAWRPSPPPPTSPAPPAPSRRERNTAVARGKHTSSPHVTHRHCVRHQTRRRRDVLCCWPAPGPHHLRQLARVHPAGDAVRHGRQPRHQGHSQQPLDRCRSITHLQGECSYKRAEEEEKNQRHSMSAE